MTARTTGVSRSARTKAISDETHSKAPGRDDELPRRTVGVLAGWSCAFLLPAQAEALAGTHPPNRALFRDELAPALGAYQAKR